MQITKSPEHLELLPYVVSQADNSQDLPGDPFATHNRPSMRVGLDVKDQLTSNLTLDATLNPDFGQVEVDPAVLNLSAFETFLPEKRPFFIEGSGVFNFGNFNCMFCSNVEAMSGFYSRRIGRAPTGGDSAVDNYAFADVPSVTTILGAAKVTGRTSNGYTVGLLDAVTGRADANVQRFDGTLGKQEVEPAANYFVGRLKRDFLDGNLVIGVMGSSVIRQMDTTYAPLLASHAELAGTDLLYTSSDHMYSLMGNVALTNVSGDPREITLREESSARYFQRPDRGNRSGGFLSDRFDTTATALHGAGGYMRLGKDAGDWLGETSINARTPGYETNDYAFQTKADYIWYNANVSRFWTTPTSWYRTYNVLVGGQQQRNFEGDLTDRQIQFYTSSTTLNFWNWDAFYFIRPPRMDDHQLRGGPVVQDPQGQYVEGGSLHRFAAGGGG